MSKFIIIDGFGNQLGGISTNENEIAKMAQEKADDRGESVYYTDSSDEAYEAVEVEPSAEPTKADVLRWETVDGYVATFPNGDTDGACDVEVQVGEAGGLWFLRTQDDAGGSDNADDEAYASREAAEKAAEALVAAEDEGLGMTAAEWLDYAAKLSVD